MSRMRADRTLINVSVFTVVMLVVATSLVVVFLIVRPARQFVLKVYTTRGW